MRRWLDLGPNKIGDEGMRHQATPSRAARRRSRALPQQQQDRRRGGAPPGRRPRARRGARARSTSTATPRARRQAWRTRVSDWLDGAFLVAHFADASKADPAISAGATRRRAVRRGARARDRPGRAQGAQDATSQQDRRRGAAPPGRRPRARRGARLYKLRLGPSEHSGGAVLERRLPRSRTSRTPELDFATSAGATRRRAGSPRRSSTRTPRGRSSPLEKLVLTTRSATRGCATSTPSRAARRPRSRSSSLGDNKIGDGLATTTQPLRDRRQPCERRRQANGATLYACMIAKLVEHLLLPPRQRRETAADRAHCSGVFATIDSA